MGLYKLKRGGHIEGVSPEFRIYRAKKEGQNVVESETDLATLYPEKFEALSDQAASQWKESQPDKSTIYGDHPPPSPSDVETLKIATGGTPESLEAQAEELERKADELRQKAQQAQQARDAQKQAREKAQAQKGSGETWFTGGQKQEGTASHPTVKDKADAPSGPGVLSEPRQAQPVKGATPTPTPKTRKD